MGQCPPGPVGSASLPARNELQDTNGWMDCSPQMPANGDVGNNVREQTGNVKRSESENLEETKKMSLNSATRNRTKAQS